MFEAIDLYNDTMTVEKYKLGLKFTAFDITHVLYESQTMGLKRLLNFGEEFIQTFDSLTFEYEQGSLDVHDNDVEDFDICLSKENTIKLIEWVDENV